MKIKRKLEMNRHQAMLEDLEQMHEKGEVSEQTYQEMKNKYIEKLKELEERLEEEHEELEIQLEELGEDMGELGLRISEKVNAAVAKAMDRVHLAVKSMPCSMEGYEMGESYSVEEVFEGSFDTDSVCIDFNTINGHIELKKWDEDTYKVVTTKKVRSYSEERARERLDKVQVNFSHQKNGTEMLRIDPDENGAAVSIVAYLPGKVKGGMLSRDHVITYDLDLESTNGHISVEGISAGKTEIETMNGRIELSQLHSETLDAETMNGRIVLEDSEVDTGNVTTENGRLELMNAKGKTLTGSTDNGSIHGKLSFEHAELRTDNGSIRITPRGRGEYQVKTDMGSISIDVDRSIPYHIEARTDVGKVRIASDLEVSSKNKHRATIKSAAYEGAEERLYIEARTDMGSIRIH
ncbi:MAG: DUF4097 family beta strand repeat protein [Theionarchaea archaeon]|nr:DUF4097 family beta strand repeat protein [Theionarchaea archaeon]